MAVGMALGSRSRSRLEAFAKGAASHLLIDAIPHYDFEHWPLSAGDFMVGLKLQSSLITGEKSGLTAMGALGGGLPDIEGGLVFFGLLSKRHAHLHRYLPHPKTSLFRALSREIPIIVLSMMIVKRSNGSGN